MAHEAPLAAAAATDQPGKVVMRFFMPAGYSRATLPEPTDSRIRILEYPETHQAALKKLRAEKPKVDTTMVIARS